MEVTSEQKISILFDTEEIKKIQYRYVNALTFGRWDEAMDCFTEDAVTDMKRGGITRGKKAITKLFKEGISQGHGHGEGSLVVHPIVNVKGDTATGEWIIYFMYSEPKTGKASDWAMGTYNMEYTRDQGQWKISKMTVRMLYGTPDRGKYLEDYVAEQARRSKNQ
jgi:ketosteroid isomerase-like protein